MPRTGFLALLALGFIAAGARAQDDDVVPRQKKRGVDNWKRAFDSEPGIVVESRSFILLSTKGLEEAKVKALGDTLDNHFAPMQKALGIPDKRKPLWAGKMTVYLFGEKRNINALIRSVEKRRPTDVGLGSFYLKGEQVHIAACTPEGKDDPSLERQALKQLVDASLNRFGGDGHGIADWMVQGFLDACGWEANPTERASGIKLAAALANDNKNPKNTKELFAGMLTGKELYVVRTALVDFLAFGPNQEKFPELLRAFKPERRGQDKTLDQILSTIDQNPIKLNRHWLTWVRKGGKN